MKSLKWIIPVALLAGCYLTYWSFGHKALQSTLKDEAQRLSSEGYQIDYAGIKTGGFPFHFKGEINRADIASPPDEAWAIRLGPTDVKALAFTPFTWTVHHRGDALLSLKGQSEVSVSPFDFDLTTRSRLNGQLKAVTANLGKADIQSISGRVPPIKRIASGYITIKPNADDMAIAADMRSITIMLENAPDIMAALGPDISIIELEARALGLTGLDSDIVDVWSQTGTVESDYWHVEWGSAKLHGAFSLTPTEGGLSGWVRLEVEDAAILVKALHKAKIISKSEFQQFNIMATVAPENEQGRKEVTFIVKHNALTFLGQTLVQF